MPKKDKLTKQAATRKRGSAKMVDVGDKPVTKRSATAEAIVRMSLETLKLIEDGLIAKGNVFDTARVAGIMAAKRTAELLPMCHPIGLDDVGVDISVEGDNSLRISARAKAAAKTGVEMEALVAASVAALTVYDMCKGVDRSIRVMDIRVIQKSGGMSGDYVAEDD
jgi:cyclic pyranopterin phosphate synthase